MSKEPFEKKVPFLFFILILLVFRFGNSFAADTMSLPPVTYQQDDGWSCGVHSTHRLLTGYGKTVDYHDMKSVIGMFDYAYPLTYTLSKKVKKKVCSKWSIGQGGGLQCLNWKVVDKVVRVKKKALVNLDDIIYTKLGKGFGIGKPTRQLSDTVAQYYNAPEKNLFVRTAQGDASNLDKIKEILSQRKPVMALMQVGHVEIDREDLVAASIIVPEALPLAFTSLDIPLLHWIVVVGYDEDYFYYYNTTSGEDSTSQEHAHLNHMRRVSIEHFNRQWSWNYDGYNKNTPIHGFLRSPAIGLDEQTMMWFDKPAPLWSAIWQASISELDY